jgi:glycosyltransferase involved in cell wall biosynthesis
VDAISENLSEDLHAFETRGTWIQTIFRKVVSLKNRTVHLAHWVFDPPRKPGLNGSSRKRIGYIKRGNFSYTNVRVGELLHERFAEYDFESIDLVEDILRAHKRVVIINVFHIFRMYGRDILLRRRSVQNCFYRTPYIFNKIKELIRERISRNAAKYVFTFQTQSLYDASVEGVPHFVYTDHTHLSNLYYPGFDREQLYSRNWIDLERNIYRNARKTFIMSNHVKHSVEQHYACDSRHVSCVYAGCNIELRPLLLDNDDYQNKRILFIGVDWERKGGPELIEAFKLVLAKIPDARLTIVGSSPEVSLPQVEVIGRIPIGEINRHFIRASVFCLPTKIEPFGIVTIEAFIHKIPVVATRIGALPDLILDGESGRLVDPEDVKGLADALIELLQDPEKCKMFGERGHEIIKSRYSWQTVGARLKNEIDSTLWN